MKVGNVGTAASWKSISKNFLVSLLCCCFIPESAFAQITLQEAMDLAEKASLEIKGSQAERDFNARRQTLSYFSLGPSLNASDSFDIYPSGMGGNVNQDTLSTTSHTMKVDATQPISGLWQNSYKVTQYSALKRAAENDLQAKQIEVRLNAAKSFMAAAQAAQEYEIYKNDVVLKENLFRETNRWFETGEADKTKVDVLDTQAAFLKAQNDLLNTKTKYENALSDLANALGQPQDAKLDVDVLNDLSYFEKSHITLEPLDVFLKKHKKSNPEIESLKNQIHAAESQQAQNTFEYFPQFNIFASYQHSTLNTDDTAEFFPTPVNNQTGTQQFFSYGVNVTWHIWDGGVVATNTFDHLKQKQVLTLQKEKREQDVEKNIQKSYKNLQTALALLERSQQILKASEEADRLARFQYKSGSISASDLVIHQTRLINAKVEWAQAHSNIDSAWLQLQADVGMRPNITNNNSIAP